MADTMISTLQQQLVSQQERHFWELQEKNAAIEEKDAIIKQKDAVIGNKDTIIENKDAIIENKDAIIENKDAISKQLQDEHRHACKQLQDEHRQDRKQLQDEHLFERLQYNQNLHETLRAFGCGLIKQAVSGKERMIGYHSTVCRQLTQLEEARPLMSVRGDGRRRGFELVTKQTEKAVEIRCAMGFRPEVDAQVAAHVLCGFKRQTNFTRSANPDDFVDNCVCRSRSGSRPRKYLRSDLRRCPI